MSQQHQHDALAERLHDVQRRVADAVARAGRALDDVTLVAVSKTHDVATLQRAYDLGVRDFGESYLQEWRDKAAQLPPDIRWHFIGRLQSNKVKLLREGVALIHGVESRSALAELERRAVSGQRVLLQVNVSGETSKGGAEPTELDAWIEAMLECERVSWAGLMTIPPYDEDPEQSRAHFRALVALSEHCKSRVAEAGLLERHPCDQRSMGMSGDFEVAIEEGATLVRVGSSIFGARDYGAG